MHNTQQKTINHLYTSLKGNEVTIKCKKWDYMVILEAVWELLVVCNHKLQLRVVLMCFVLQSFDNKEDFLLKTKEKGITEMCTICYLTYYGMDYILTSQPCFWIHAAGIVKILSRKHV